MDIEIIKSSCETLIGLNSVRIVFSGDILHQRRGSVALRFTPTPKCVSYRPYFEIENLATVLF